MFDTIVVGPGDFGKGGKGGGTGVASRGWNTHSARRIRIDPANANLAFDEANARVGAKGGTLYVAPSSTGTYTFAAPAVMTKPVRLQFDRGVSMVKATNAATAIRFTKTAEVHGAHFAGNVDATAPTEQSFLEFDGTADAQACAESRVVDCTFRPIQNANNVHGFFDIRAIGFQTLSSDVSRIFHVERCAHIIMGGTANQWAWVGEETSGQGTNEYTGTPYGLGFLNVQHWRHVHVRGCDVVGNLDGVAGQVCGVPIIIDDCPYLDVNGLTFSSGSNLCTAGTEHAAPLVLIRGVDQEGCHGNVSNVFAELMECKNLLASQAARWVKVVAAEAGRMTGNCHDATFRAVAAPGGQGFQLIGCSNHNVHGKTGVGNRLYYVEGLTNFSAIGCTATFRNDSTYPFVVVNCPNSIERGLLYSPP